MNELLQTATRLQLILQENKQSFCFMGGLAVQLWGEPRATRDVDATIFVGFGNELPSIELLLKNYHARIDNAKLFAQENRILLLRDPQNGTGIDLSLGGLDYEQRAIERSALYEFKKGTNLLTCCPEDLITFKAFANRDIDWHDIKGILIRQKGKLDFNLIKRELKPLVDIKQEPQILDKLELLRIKYL